MPSIATVLALTIVALGPVKEAERIPAYAPAWPQREAFRAGFESPLPPGDRPAVSAEAAPPQGKAAAPATLSPATRESPLPLTPPGSANHGDSAKRTGGVSSGVTVAGSLAVVLGLFFLVAWALRRTAPRGLTPLPGEVFELLGRAPLSGRQQVHLLRCGNKLLLVSVTPAGAETLTEITDPPEVDRLAGLCQQARPNSATAAFRQVLQHWEARHA